MQPGKLLTIENVAEILQVGRHKASSLMDGMPHVQLPGSRTKRVRVDDFERWLSDNLVVPGMKPEKKKKKAPPPIPYDQLFEPDGRIKRRRTSKGG